MLQQRQLVIKALVTQLDIEDIVRTKYTITHFHSIAWMWSSIIVTIYRIVLEQRYQTSHYIVMTSKLLRRCIKKSEEELGRENIRDYIRKNDGRVHYIDD